MSVPRETGGTNRLASEQSPYLLQHAGNPVDWYPWSEEALERARKEDKPIFLSAGYATCHWCHVMERESFEDDQVAALLNKDFVSIKVDREERPDIDNVYMKACQVMTGGGGWPLTIIMTPDGKPFFAATYIPKNTGMGRRGMLQLLPRVAKLWKSRKEDVMEDARRATELVVAATRGKKGEPVGEKARHEAYRSLSMDYDEENGGFGGSVKFPTPHQLVFLMGYAKDTGNEKALEMADHTLEAMRRGGIFDQLGYGFHRYSTEPTWLVPHFEKMLYDQALLLWAYIEAYQATGKEEHGRTAEEIIEYVLRDLRSPQGGFFSAEDADSEGIEGKFYLWRKEEILDCLGAQKGVRFCSVFKVGEKGNFTDPHGQVERGASILRLAPGRSDAALNQEMEKARLELLEIRSKRPRPFLDDKILTDWNALMIGALARASVVLQKPEYLRHAEEAYGMIDGMRGADGRLLHRYRDGNAGISATLDDYAFFTFALIELYLASSREHFLDKAKSHGLETADLFAGEEGGALFLTAKDAEELLVRPVELYDGALPSGNSFAYWNSVRLARLTGDERFDKIAREVSAGFGPDVARMSAAYTCFLSALGN